MIVATKMQKLKQPEPAAEPWHVRTQADVSRFFRCNRTTCAEWFAAGAPKAQNASGYDLRAIMEWKLARARDPAAGNVSNGAAAEFQGLRRAVELEIATHQATLLRIKAEAAAGELINAAEVGQVWNMGLLRIKNRLEAFPDELAMTFPKKTRAQNTAEFKDKVFGLLKEMSQWKPTEATPTAVRNA